ncbi:hypothetical protein GGI42DRAFT_211381 [Trichoderma sp. SZMC 28013]
MVSSRPNCLVNGWISWLLPCSYIQTLPIPLSLSSIRGALALGPAELDRAPQAGACRERALLAPGTLDTAETGGLLPVSFTLANQHSAMLVLLVLLLAERSTILQRYVVSDVEPWSNSRVFSQPASNQRRPITPPSG